MKIMKGTKGQSTNSKATPTKDTGPKNNDSDNDVDYKNRTKTDNCTSATEDKSSTAGSK
jgi:hypothetical protein